MLAKTYEAQYRMENPNKRLELSTGVWAVRRGTEFLVIVIGIVLSFYMEDLRQNLEKQEYKDQLISELIVASSEDLKQIGSIQSNLNECLVAADLLIKDLASGGRELSDERIAEAYLTISQKMYTSFFQQSGTYQQLIESGSLELIESTNFRKVLLDTYTHLLHRNQALSRTLDDYYVVLTSSMGPFVTVFPVEEKGQGFVYSDKRLSDFRVDKALYGNSQNLAILVETKNLVSNYLDLLGVFSASYEQLIIYAEEEESL